MRRALVDVDYDVLPAVSDCRDAVKPGAPRAHSDVEDNVAAFVRMEYGDVDAAFAQRAARVRGDACGCTAAAAWRWRRAPSRRATIRRAICSPSGRRRRRRISAAACSPTSLGRNLEAIRMIAPDVGGGFGPKAPFYAEEAVIPAAALRLGRPVRWCEDRREHFLTATQERDQHYDIAIAVDERRQDSGRARHDAARHRRVHAVGHHHALHRGGDDPGPYVVPNYRLECTVAITNKVPTTPVRGAGRPQAVFAMERMMDRVARELEPRSRRRTPAQPHPARADALRGRPDLPRRHAARLSRRRLSARASAPRWRVPATRASGRARQQARREGRYIGIGIANYVEGTGLGPFEGVTVRVLPNGKVAVATGATNQGQGQRTALSQIVADQVGCRIEDVVMTMGDTAAISQGVGAFASRQTVNAGSSALMAGTEVRRKIVALAAQTLAVPQERHRPRGRRGDSARRQPAAAFVRRAGAPRARARPASRSQPGRRRGWSTPPGSRRRRPLTATARTWSRSRST